MLRSARPASRVVLLASLALVLSACAPKEAESPGAEIAPPIDQANLPANASGGRAGLAGLSAQRASGAAKVGEALRQIEVAGGACGDACPALAALRLGVKAVCDVDETKDDAIACKEARASLATAETEVKKSCGACIPPKLDDDGDAGGALGY